VHYPTGHSLATHNVNGNAPEVIPFAMPR